MVSSLKNKIRSGYVTEMRVKKILRKCGWKVIRMPKSGRSKEPVPDIIAVNGDRLVAIEVKTVSDKINLYVNKRQLSKCFEFIRVFNRYKGEVVIAALFKMAVNTPFQEDILIFRKINSNKKKKVKISCNDVSNWSPGKCLKRRSFRIRIS